LELVVSAWSAHLEQPTDTKRLQDLRHQADVHRAVLRGLLPDASIRP